MDKIEILYIGNKLINYGFAPSVIESLGHQLELSGFKVNYAGIRLNPILRLFEMIFKTIQLRKRVYYVLIDTYSTTAFWYAFIIGMISRIVNLRYIPILHGGNLPERIKKSQRASKILFRNSYTNVAVSGYLKNEFEKAGYKTVVIPNNLNISKYSFKLRENPQPRLLWVRSFHKQYNPNMAADVLSEILKTYPEAELCMVGPEKDGSLKQFIQYTEKLGINDKVKITGLLPKNEWIRLSEEYDFFINTTNYDNTPVSVIEAMALGLAIVSTDPGGIRYLLEDKKDALLVKKGSADVMTKKIIFLIENPENSAEIIASARKKAESFSWERIQPLWLDLLK